jgi:hypothetical protein
MRRAPQWLLPVSSVLLVVIAACGASTLRRSQVDFSDLADLRSEYTTRNPDSPYRDNVSRGEIVKGMDVFGVLASWGLPERRVPDGAEFERWLYIDSEDAANQPVGYALEFEKGVLKSWDVQRSGVGLKTRETTDISGPPKQEPQKGKTIPTE